MSILLIAIRAIVSSEIEITATCRAPVHLHGDIVPITGNLRGG